MKLVLAFTCTLALIGGISCNSRKDGRNPTNATEGLIKEGRGWLKNINAQEAFLMLGSKPAPIVMDIRTPAEHKGGRIEGSMLNNYYSKDFELELSKLDRSQSVIVHCAAGGRSSESLMVFKKLGFENVLHLDGGIKD